jgi:holo-[acyl-carrier protein] synthase
MTGEMRIGIDLMEIPRFARIAAHERYRALVFTPAELAQAEGLAPPQYTQRLAGRFSAKEAVCKVLGRGFGQGLVWRDIEVTADGWGAPHVTLTGGALRLADLVGIRHISLALTHQVDLVVAVAVACGRPEAGAAEDAQDRLGLPSAQPRAVQTGSLR